MEYQNDLIQFLRTLAPSMNEQDIFDAIRKPFGQIAYEIRQTNRYYQRDEILKALEQGNSSQDTENQKSKEVLDQLNDIVRQWSQDIAYNEKNVSKDQLKSCSALLLPYGSILLGVADSKSDIDLVCVAPEFIDRHQHFFLGLFEILTKIEGMEQINKIESTYNPIIKMIFKGIHIDINFAQLNCDTIPENIDDNLDELRTNLLQGEEKSINALNGRKNGILIRNSVRNQIQFVETLRIIKIWAKKRCLSGNIIGYLGGISWAIMVSKICQLFPGLDCGVTLDLFFQVYSLWNWKMPIIIDDSDIEIKQFSTQCWKDDEKKNEFMKIITPAYPFFNSTYKVSRITYDTLLNELKRGSKLTGNLKELIEEFDFFDHYKFYIALSIVSKDTVNFHKWTGFCEAQLPKLLRLLQTQEGEQEYEFRITPNPISNIERDSNISLSYFIGIKKLKFEAWPLFLRTQITNFAIELLARKNHSKFGPEHNMKIYLATAEDIERMKFKSPEKSYEDIVEKKVKLDHNLHSAELIKKISLESIPIDAKAVQSVLDDMF